jgi:ABC-type transport system involved in multi-copper enzyme maturation permease subunit
LRYEFRMQVRRKALWITFLAFCLPLLSITLTPWSGYFDGLSTAHLVVNWSLAVQFLHPLAFGVLLADRLPRDRRLGVTELLQTLPAAPGGRFLGKFLGATLATLAPVLLVYAAGVGYIVYDTGDIGALPLALAAFAVINLPGLLFVAAFSVSCPAVLWVPLYQFLFVGYWFWGNLIPPGTDIPSLSRTVLTPLGEYMANGFFGTEATAVRATPLEGALSAGLLLALGALALVCANHYLRWQQARQ